MRSDIHLKFNLMWLLQYIKKKIKSREQFCLWTWLPNFPIMTLIKNIGLYQRPVTDIRYRLYNRGIIKTYILLYKLNYKEYFQFFQISVVVHQTKQQFCFYSDHTSYTELNLSFCSCELSLSFCSCVNLFSSVVFIREYY